MTENTPKEEFLIEIPVPLIEVNDDELITETVVSDGEGGYVVELSGPQELLDELQTFYGRPIVWTNRTNQKQE